VKGLAGGGDAESFMDWERRNPVVAREHPSCHFNAHNSHQIPKVFVGEISTKEVLYIQRSLGRFDEGRDEIVKLRKWRSQLCIVSSPGNHFPVWSAILIPMAEFCGM
jgi:hypothetical protein